MGKLDTKQILMMQLSTLLPIRDPMELEMMRVSEEVNQMVTATFQVRNETIVHEIRAEWAQILLNLLYEWKCEAWQRASELDEPIVVFTRGAPIHDWFAERRYAEVDAKLAEFGANVRSENIFAIKMMMDGVRTEPYLVVPYTRETIAVERQMHLNMLRRKIYVSIPRIFAVAPGEVVGAFGRIASPCFTGGMSAFFQDRLRQVRDAPAIAAAPESVDVLYPVSIRTTACGKTVLLRTAATHEYRSSLADCLARRLAGIEGADGPGDVRAMYWDGGETPAIFHVRGKRLAVAMEQTDFLDILRMLVAWKFFEREFYRLPCGRRMESRALEECFAADVFAEEHGELRQLSHERNFYQKAYRIKMFFDISSIDRFADQRPGHSVCLTSGEILALSVGADLVQSYRGWKYPAL